jgi:hypothetical protein
VSQIKLKVNLRMEEDSTPRLAAVRAWPAGSAVVVRYASDYEVLE